MALLQYKEQKKGARLSYETSWATSFKSNREYSLERLWEVRLGRAFALAPDGKYFETDDLFQPHVRGGLITGSSYLRTSTVLQRHLCLSRANAVNVGFIDDRTLSCLNADASAEVLQRRYKRAADLVLAYAWQLTGDAHDEKELQGLLHSVVANMTRFVQWFEFDYQLKKKSVESSGKTFHHRQAEDLLILRNAVSKYGGSGIATCHLYYQGQDLGNAARPAMVFEGGDMIVSARYLVQNPDEDGDQKHLTKPECVMLMCHYMEVWTILYRHPEVRQHLDSTAVVVLKQEKQSVEFRAADVFARANKLLADPERMRHLVFGTKAGAPERSWASAARGWIAAWGEQLQLHTSAIALPEARAQAAPRGPRLATWLRSPFYHPSHTPSCLPRVIKQT